MLLPKLFYRLLGVLCLCLIFIVDADAQLKKGDYHVDFRSSNFYSSQGVQNPEFDLDFTYLRMVSNRFMVGGQLSFLRSHIAGGFGDVFIEDISFLDVQVRQISRYYLKTGRAAPFMSLEHLFRLRKVDGSSDNFSGYQLSPGLGLTYFLRPNIALEGLLTSDLISSGDFNRVQHAVNFNIGLKLFFNNKFFAKAVALPERILKKGNIVSSTRLNFNKELGDSDRGRINSAPNIRYFLTDRFNIFAGYTRQRSRLPLSRRDDIIRNQLDLSLGAAYYIRLSDQLFWNFDLSNTISMSGGKLSNTFDDGIDQIFTSISTSLQYFSGPFKFYGGVGYMNTSGKGFINDELINLLSSHHEFFTGVDYFISDYIYLNSDLRFSDFNSLDFRLSGKSIRLDFGVGFIIAGKGE